MEEELTEEEKARMRTITTYRKVVCGILLRWWPCFVTVFVVVFALLSAYLAVKASKSVKRYEAKTRLLFNPKKVLRVEAPNDKQLMSILDRRSLKRRVAEKVPMDEVENMCLSADMKIVQERRPTNLFTLTADSKTPDGAVAKANAYAQILIDEYVAFRSSDLADWRKSLDERRKKLVDEISEIDAEESAIKSRTGVLTPKEAILALNKLVSDQRRNLSALGVDLANEELRKRKLEASVGGSGPAVMANAQAIRRRVDALSSLEAELLTLRERYTDINPKVAGKIQERDERIAEMKEFLKSKGAEDLDIDKIDQIEKAAGELIDCATRIEAITEKRRALEQEISDNEKKALALAATVQDFDRLESRRQDLAATLHDIDEQLDGISYAESSLRNDLRQIERAGGSGDGGPFGPKQAVFAFGGAVACSGWLVVLVVVLELVLGKVRGGREVAAYDGINFIGSLPKPGAMPETEAQEVMGVIAMRALLAGKDAKAVLLCRLPGAELDRGFLAKMDYMSSMSGASCFLLDVVSQDGFVPPDGAEQMLGISRSGQRGWFPAANRFAMAPTEQELVKADLAALGETFDNVFVRMEGGVRIGGTFFDQLLELCDAAMLFVGTGSTSRRVFAYARRHLKASGKPVIAIATGAGEKTVRAEMEEFS